MRDFSKFRRSLNARRQSRAPSITPSYAPPAQSVGAHLKGRLWATLKNKPLLLVVGAMASGGLLQVIGEGPAVRGGGAALTIFANLGDREKAMRASRLLSSLALTAIALIGGKEGERPSRHRSPFSAGA